MEELKKIDIVIVNWNSGDQLKKCLDSIARLECDTLSKVIVVDNDSFDGSADSLETVGLPLQVIYNNENLGFACACNHGARECHAPYLLFLNPDTEIFDHSLTKPLAFMEEDNASTVGICGIQLVDEKGQISRSCARFPTIKRFAMQAIGLNKLPGLKGEGVHMDDWDHLTNKTVDHVIGAFFFMRRQLFDVLGGFDERFFVYLEDVDFSLRAKKAGWESYYLADAQAFHKGGGSSQRVKAIRLFYSLQSRSLYSFKHFNGLQAWLLFGVMATIEPITRSVFSLFRGGLEDLKNTWSAYARWYRNLPTILNRL